MLALVRQAFERFLNTLNAITAMHEKTNLKKIVDICRVYTYVDSNVYYPE